MCYAKRVFLQSLLSSQSMVFSEMASFRGYLMQTCIPKESHLAPTCLHPGKDNALPAKATISNSGFSKVLSLWLQKGWDTLISECRRSSYVCVCIRRARLLATLWTVLHQAPLSMEQVAISFFRDLPDPGIEPASLKSPALAGGFLTTSTTWETHTYNSTHHLSTL